MIVGNKKKSHQLYLERSRKTISYAIDQIQKSPLAPFVQNIYLYGSCARKEQKYGSDVDLFLELSPKVNREELQHEMTLLKANVTPLDDSLPEVDLKIEIGNKWRDSSLLYYKNIKKEGMSIWPKLHLI